MKTKVLPLLVLAAAVGAAYAAFEWATRALIHGRIVVTVPDLAGKPVPQALDLLAAQRLALQKEEEQFDKRFPAGTIVRQNPPAGAAVREGRVVRVTISQGGETLFVPNLVGQPLRYAQTALQNAGLSVGEIERRPSLRYEKDQVMATDPPGGSITGKNGLVSIVLSEGPPGSDVLLTPDFVGRGLSKAKEWAGANQMPMTVREETDISKPDNEIVMQSPTADSPIRPGDTLTVVVNRSSDAAPEDGSRIYYEVPKGATDRDIRILLIDEAGEREVYRKTQAPGSKVDFRVPARGRARVRIFVNGVMDEEQSLHQ